MTHQPRQFDKRSISPVVGIAILIAIIVAVALGLTLTGVDILGSSEDPQIEAQFRLDVENETHTEIIYTDGDEFNPENTHKIEILLTDTNTRATLYNESGILNSTGERSFRPPTKVLDLNHTIQGSFSAGTGIQVIWIPEKDKDLEIVLDELLIPPKEELISGGIIRYDELEIAANATTDGTSPRP